MTQPSSGLPLIEALRASPGVENALALYRFVTEEIKKHGGTNDCAAILVPPLMECILELGNAAGSKKEQKVISPAAMSLIGSIVSLLPDTHMYPFLPRLTDNLKQAGKDYGDNLHSLRFLLWIVGSISERGETSWGLTVNQLPHPGKTKDRFVRTLMLQYFPRYVGKQRPFTNEHLGYLKKAFATKDVGLQSSALTALATVGVQAIVDPPVLAATMTFLAKLLESPQDSRLVPAVVDCFAAFLVLGDGNRASSGSGSSSSGKAGWAGWLKGSSSGGTDTRGSPIEQFDGFLKANVASKQAHLILSGVLPSVFAASIPLSALQEGLDICLEVLLVPSQKDDRSNVAVTIAHGIVLWSRRLKSSTLRELLAKQLLRHISVRIPKGRCLCALHAIYGVLHHLPGLDLQLGEEVTQTTAPLLSHPRTPNSVLYAACNVAALALSQCPPLWRKVSTTVSHATEAQTTLSKVMPFLTPSPIIVEGLASIAAVELREGNGFSHSTAPLYFQLGDMITSASGKHPIEELQGVVDFVPRLKALLSLPLVRLASLGVSLLDEVTHSVHRAAIYRAASKKIDTASAAKHEESTIRAALNELFNSTVSNIGCTWPPAPALAVSRGTIEWKKSTTDTDGDELSPLGSQRSAVLDAAITFLGTCCGQGDFSTVHHIVVKLFDLYSEIAQGTEAAQRTLAKNVVVALHAIVRSVADCGKKWTSATAQKFSATLNEQLVTFFLKSDRQEVIALACESLVSLFRVAPGAVNLQRLFSTVDHTAVQSRKVACYLAAAVFDQVPSTERQTHSLASAALGETASRNGLALDQDLRETQVVLAALCLGVGRQRSGTRDSLHSVAAPAVEKLIAAAADWTCDTTTLGLLVSYASRSALSPQLQETLSRAAELQVSRLSVATGSHQLDEPFMQLAVQQKFPTAISVSIALGILERRNDRSCGLGGAICAARSLSRWGVLMETCALLEWIQKLFSISDAEWNCQVRDAVAKTIQGLARSKPSVELSRLLSAIVAAKPPRFATEAEGTKSNKDEYDEDEGAASSELRGGKSSSTERGVVIASEAMAKRIAASCIPLCFENASQSENDVQVLTAALLGVCSLADSEPSVMTYAFEGFNALLSLNVDQYPNTFLSFKSQLFAAYRGLVESWNGDIGTIQLLLDTFRQLAVVSFADEGNVSKCVGAISTKLNTLWKAAAPEGEESSACVLDSQKRVLDASVFVLVGFQGLHSTAIERNRPTVSEAVWRAVATTALATALLAVVSAHLGRAAIPFGRVSPFACEEHCIGGNALEYMYSASNPLSLVFSFLPSGSHPLPSAPLSSAIGKLVVLSLVEDSEGMLRKVHSKAITREELSRALRCCTVHDLVVFTQCLRKLVVAKEELGKDVRQAVVDLLVLIPSSNGGSTGAKVELLVSELRSAGMALLSLSSKRLQDEVGVVLKILRLFQLCRTFKTRSKATTPTLDTAAVLQLLARTPVNCVLTNSSIEVDDIRSTVQLLKDCCHQDKLLSIVLSPHPSWSEGSLWFLAALSLDSHVHVLPNGCDSSGSGVLPFSPEILTATACVTEGIILLDPGHPVVLELIKPNALLMTAMTPILLDALTKVGHRPAMQHAMLGDLLCAAVGSLLIRKPTVPTEAIIGVLGALVNSPLDKSAFVKDSLGKLGQIMPTETRQALQKQRPETFEKLRAVMSGAGPKQSTQSQAGEPAQATQQLKPRAKLSINISSFT